jgi:uncharacterized paraquat-inducible protein A
MTSGKDKSGQDALNAKVQAASARVDSALARMTGADAKMSADFKAVWDQFKATREKESSRRFTLAIPPRPRKLAMAFNTSVCPRCGVSFRVNN